MLSNASRFSKLIARKFSGISQRSYYEVLGVERSADLETIKTAYKEKVKRHHPDVNKDSGAEEDFKEILKAYQILKSDFDRQIYDSEGATLDSINENSTGNSSSKFKRKYYHNRWYDFKRPEDDLRNDFDKGTERGLIEKLLQSSRNKVIFIVILLVVYELYDMNQRNNNKKYLDFKRELNDLRNNSDLQRYIAEREVKYIGETDEHC